MKKIYLIATTLLLLLAILEVVYLTQSDALASESMKAEELRAQIEKLEEENSIIHSEILSYSSMQIISSRAAELGYDKPSEIIVLKKQDSIALKHE